MNRAPIVTPQVARLAGEGEGFFVSGGVVLSHERETLVLVAQEHGCPRRPSLRPDRVVWALRDAAAAWLAFNQLRRSPVPGSQAAA